jgi:hypothetical protein
MLISELPQSWFRHGFRCPIDGTPGYVCGGPTFMAPSPIWQPAGTGGPIAMAELIIQDRVSPDTGMEYSVQVTQEEADAWEAQAQAQAEALAAQQAQAEAEGAEAPSATTKSRSPKATGDVNTK